MIQFRFDLDDEMTTDEICVLWEAIAEDFTAKGHKPMGGDTEEMSLDRWLDAKQVKPGFEIKSE